MNRGLVLLAILTIAYTLFLPGVEGQKGPIRFAQAKGRPAFASASEKWTPPQLLSFGLPEADYPALAVGKEGELHLVWEGKDDSTAIRYAHFDGQLWQVSPISTGDSPAIAIDAQGQPHITYADEFAGVYQVYYSSSGEQGWHSQQVSGTSAPSHQPTITIGAHGDAYIVWVDTLGDTKQLYYAYSSDGGRSWPQSQPIPQASGLAPSADLAPDGRLWVAWMEKNPSDDTWDIWVIRRPRRGLSPSQAPLRRLRPYPPHLGGRELSRRDP